MLHLQYCTITIKYYIYIFSTFKNGEKKKKAKTYPMRIFYSPFKKNDCSLIWSNTLFDQK